MLERLKKSAAAQIRNGQKRKISLVDTTFRDAQQCLWATRMSTEHMLPVAHMLDDAGFETLEVMGLVQYDGAVLFLKQNPLERLRLLRQRAKKTPLRVAVRSNLLRGFAPVPSDVTNLFVERQVANGAREIVFLEALHDWDNLEESFKTARRLGVTTTIMILYNLAPGYDANYYSDVAREVVRRFDIDKVLFYDAGGILTPENVRALVPSIKAAIGGVRLEFITHCLTGLGPWVSIEAAASGVDCLVTAVEPMANGSSVPGVQTISRNLREIGFDVNVDDRSLEKVGDYFHNVAFREGKPIGVAAEYDPRQYKTQYAGGALANMVAQLNAAGLQDRLPEVLEEIARVRVELGSPIMATPFPAIVAAQAVFNVLTGDRYSMVPNEVKKYACGHYGKLRIPIDQNVIDRIIENGSKEIALVPPELPPVVPGLRKRYPNVSDDERLIRYMYGDEAFDGLRPAKENDDLSVDHPLATLVKGLARRERGSRIHISASDFAFAIG